MPKLKQIKVPNPGSKEAQTIGCACPVMDNCYGKGYMGRENIFIVNSSCSVHNKNKEKKHVSN